MKKVRLFFAALLASGVLVLGPMAASTLATTWECVGFDGGILCSNEFGGYVFCDRSGCEVV